MTPETPDNPQPEGLSFPCEYPVKAMGATKIILKTRFISA